MYARLRFAMNFFRFVIRAISSFSLFKKLCVCVCTSLHLQQCVHVLCNGVRVVVSRVSFHDVTRFVQHELFKVPSDIVTCDRVKSETVVFPNPALGSTRTSSSSTPLFLVHASLSWNLSIVSTIETWDAR